MAYKVAKIPFSKIKKIEYYVNTGKRTLKQIKAQKGCQYIINGGLFEWSWKACPLLKVNGKMISTRPWAKIGYGVDTNNLTYTYDIDKFKNFITCVDLYDTNGKPLSKLVYNSDMGGARQRSAIGISKNNELVMYCTNSGTTPEKLRDIMTNYGCTSGIMLDGGGSSQCDFDGQVISSSRVVHNLILVYTQNDSTSQGGSSSETQTPSAPSIDSGMKIVQKYMYNNRCFTNQVKANKKKYMLHSTGTPGAMMENIFNTMNKSSASVSVENIIDNTGIYKTLPYSIVSWHCGKSGNQTHIACEICEPNDTRLLDVNWIEQYRNGKNNIKWIVTLIQKELTAWGFDPKGIDGNIGPGCDTAIKAFQKKQGLSQDGHVGLNTLHAFQKRTGSYLKYDANKNAAYFNNVYNKAVYLFAEMIKQTGGSYKDIVCHSEGYKQGIASNHADVMHWFPQHGKTMDDFRNDVNKMLGNTTTNPSTPQLSSRIEIAQDKMNKKFNSGLAIDGSWGPASKKAYIKAIQQMINKLYNGKLTVDGSFGPATKKACPYLKYYTLNDLVWLLQLGLYIKGYNIEIDGSFGPACKSTVIAYQKAKGLNAEGLAGPLTFETLVK